VTETARILLTVVVLTGVGLSVFAWRVSRTMSGAPDRLVAQLHLSHWAAMVLAVQGAIGIGLAISSESAPSAALELALGLLPIAAAMLVLRSEPVQALQLAALALGIHAALAFAHRPGWLEPDLAPAWFWLGQMTYDLYIATLCSVSSRK
jgi:uncharacterized membrane protein HdeD (DUF308 family)